MSSKKEGINDLVNFTQHAIKEGKALFEALEKIIEDHSDIFDTMKELAAPTRTAFKLINLSKTIRFKKFIQSYAKQINQNITLNDETLKNIEKYLDKDKNLEYIAEIIDAAVNSKSSLCSNILGLYAGEFLSKLRDIDYKDIILITTLKLLVDEDIKNLYDLYDIIKGIDIKKTYEIEGLSRSYDIVKSRKLEFELTVEKLKNTLVLGKGSAGYWDIPYGWGTFQFIDNTFYFLDVLNKCNTRKLLSKN